MNDMNVNVWQAIRDRNLSIPYAAQAPRRAWTDPDDFEFSEKRREYFRPTGDFLRDGFAPVGSTTTDFTVIRHEDSYHLFGVAGYGDCFTNWPGQYDHVFHATTKNFQDWCVHGKALQPHPDHDYERGKIWPPFVFKSGEQFHMIYCGLDTDNCQCLCQAVSDDLFEWRRQPHNPIVGAQSLDWVFKRDDGRLRHCRDPHVEVIDGKFYLYYSTIGADANPAVGLACSDDLAQWTDLGPCLRSPIEGHWVLESPLVFERDGRFGLIVLPFNKILWSKDPTDFHAAECTPLHHEFPFIAPEIIDRSHDDCWLMAFYGCKGRRISLGAMNWHDDHVDVELIQEPAQLSRWLG